MGSLASGFGQATGFDSPVGVPTIYHLSAALNVRSRVSNPRPIALSPSNLCPESLSVGDLATSPAPAPRAYALWLTQHAFLPLWQAWCIGSCRRAATAASQAARERFRSAVPRCSRQHVLAAGEVGWRALASASPVGPAEARDVGRSARRTAHGSPGAVVALANGSGGRTASLVSLSLYRGRVTHACI